MSRKIVLAAAAAGAALILLFAFVYPKLVAPSIPSKASLLPRQHDSKTVNTQNQQLELHRFIKTNLSGPYGVYTNLLDTNQSQEAATGHEVLSESASLMMRYAALTKQQQAFETEWLLARQTFDLPSGFSYRFSPKLQKQYSLNAAVDDLRMIRALYEAGYVFNEHRYTEEANRYGDRFYAHNVKNDRLYDFYDESYRTTNSFFTLCYVDFKTLELLPISASKRQALIGAMQQIVQNGYLSDSFPFYETRFSYERNTYMSENINTVESLLTILALAEVKQHKEASIRYIKEQVRNGALYGQYTRDGTAANQIQSTAIYAITAMIGSEIGDQALYEDSIHRMNAYRIADSGSPLYGGFGDAKTNQAYSFDNLMALLAYAY